jgi:hypothetical protein
MKEFGMVLAGLIIGGFLGWLSGVAWFELVEVPKAASMDPAMAASYLCAEGSYLPLLSVAPGAIVGVILSAIIVARSGQAGVHSESQDQSQ